MNLENYKILIQNLPVRQQCFVTKRTNWEKAENQIEWLKSMNDKLFGDKQKLIISRQDIFETIEIKESIIKTIYWGYPRGMRGNHFVNILKQIDLIEVTLKTLKQIVYPTKQNFNEMTINLKKISGVGISTYSKFLYFFNIKFNDNPCQILDKRIIEVFSSDIYLELQKLNKLNYYNAEKNYLAYIELIKLTAKKLNTKEENIEQFLFTYGNKLKP
jgi:hypothetical protein